VGLIEQWWWVFLGWAREGHQRQKEQLEWLLGLGEGQVMERGTQEILAVEEGAGWGTEVGGWKVEGLVVMFWVTGKTGLGLWRVIEGVNGGFWK